jgi:hypothetical protein
MDLESLYADIRKYVDAQINYIRLATAEQAIRLMSSGALFLVVLGLGMISLALLELALALWLGSLLGASYWGFVILGGLNLILVLMALAFRKRILQSSRNAMTRALYQNPDE